MKILLSKTQFRDNKAVHPEFPRILRMALEEQMYVTVRQEGSEVAIKVTEKTEENEAIRFEGKILSSKLDVARLSTASEKLVLPFILNIRSVDVAPRAFIFSSSRNRSVGGVIFRNILFALIRNEQIVFKPLYCWSGETKDSAFLVRQYLYVFKSIFPEPLLGNRKSPDALALLITNIFHPCVNFKSELLSAGCRRISNRIRAARSYPESHDQLISEILSLRERTMKMY